MFILTENNKYINTLYIKNFDIKQFNLSSTYSIIAIDIEGKEYTIKNNIQTEKDAREIINKLIKSKLHDDILIL